MASEIDIYNITLNFLGADQIMDAGQNSENAQILQSLYATTRDAVLRAHPWNCALTRAQLAVMAVAPAWGYTAQFQLPADPYCLRVHRLEDDALPFVVEGRRILCDAAGPLNILYVARVTDAEQYDALLLQTIAARLAYAGGYRITNNPDMTANSWKWYGELLQEARSIDGQEGAPEDMGAGDFLGVRY